MEQEPRVLRREPRPVDAIVWEPSARWVRGMFGATTVVDSRAPVLVWEPGTTVPLYAFPEADVRADLLRPAARPPARAHSGSTVFHDLVVDGVTVPNAAWCFPGDLAGHVAFEWAARVGRGLDRWTEEDEEITVHPRDPYIRVDALPSSRHVVVRLDGEVLADTREPVLLFETGLPTRYYVDRTDVAFEHLIASDTETACPYKGVTTGYWSARVRDVVHEDVAWSYQYPDRAVGAVAGMVAFYNERVDLVVDGVPLPRPRTHFVR
jgi:uncharacterized protein (DUF427 family)